MELKLTINNGEGCLWLGYVPCGNSKCWAITVHYDAALDARAGPQVQAHAATGYNACQIYMRDRDG